MSVNYYKAELAVPTPDDEDSWLIELWYYRASIPDTHVDPGYEDDPTGHIYFFEGKQVDRGAILRYIDSDRLDQLEDDAELCDYRDAEQLDKLYGWTP